MVSFIVLMGLALTFGGMVNGSSHNITWNSEKEAAGKSRFSQCMNDYQSLVPYYEYHFSIARYLMRVSAEPEDPNALSRTMKKFVRYWEGKVRGLMYSKKNDFVYARCWKCGSMALTRNIRDHFPDYVGRLPKKSSKIGCYVSFIRNPLARFASGYNEFLVRIELNHKFNRLRRQGTKTMTYLHGPSNGTHRPAAFLNDVLRGGFHDHRSFPHVLPMFSFLKQIPRIDHLLRSEDLNSSYVEFQRRCTADKRPIVGLAEGVGSHKSSNDPLGTYSVMKEEIKTDPIFTRALCHLYAADFYCFALEAELPPECQGMDLSIRGRYTRKDVEAGLAAFRARLIELGLPGDIQHSNVATSPTSSGTAGSAAG